MEIIEGLGLNQSLQIALLITAFWFPIYWIFGGVTFATIAFIRVTKLRKVRFSCLFTLESIFVAAGAAYFGMTLGKQEIATCLVDANGFLDSLVSVIGCGILSIFISGAIGFVALVLIGLFILFLSRAANQSWVDSNEGIEEEKELIFDVK